MRPPWPVTAVACIVAGAAAIAAWEGIRAWYVYAPAALLVGVVAAWPLLGRSAPWAARHNRWHACPQCGTEWRPADEQGALACPACAAT